MADDFCISCFLLELAAGGSGTGAARLLDVDTGHGCFPPSPVISASPDVFINYRPAARLGDPLAPHACPNSPPHGRNLSAGSATVFINGQPASRIGDAIGCGGSMASGSGDVFIGDIGTKSPGYTCLKAAKGLGSAFISPAQLPPPQKPATVAQPSTAFAQPASTGTAFVA